MFLPKLDDASAACIYSCRPITGIAGQAEPYLEANFERTEAYHSCGTTSARNQHLQRVWLPREHQAVPTDTFRFRYNHMTMTDPSNGEQPESPAIVGVPKRDFEDSDLFIGVYAYVENYMGRYDCSHDFSHIIRVLALAKHILAEERILDPAKSYQKQAILLAALLHDVGDKKYARPGEDSEQAVEQLLQKLGCPPRFVAKVALIVQHVSYSNEVKRPQLVKAMMGAHPELAVVQDADRLDAIGAIGIARTFAFGAAKASDRGLQGCIDHFTDKLENIEGMMKTETGRRLARERTQRLKDFRRWWEEENEIIS